MKPGRALRIAAWLPVRTCRRAKTPLANFVTGLVVMMVLLVLTSIFTNMSQNVQVRACGCVLEQAMFAMRRKAGRDVEAFRMVLAVMLLLLPLKHTLAKTHPSACGLCDYCTGLACDCAPACLQGAIIIVGVIGLIDYPEAIYLWHINKFDFLVWNVAFLFTIFLVSPPPALLPGLSPAAWVIRRGIACGIAPVDMFCVKAAVFPLSASRACVRVPVHLLRMLLQVVLHVVLQP